MKGNQSRNIDGQLNSLRKQYVKRRITRSQVEIQTKSLYASIYEQPASIEMAVTTFMKSVR